MKYEIFMVCRNRLTFPDLLRRKKIQAYMYYLLNISNVLDFLLAAI